MKTRRAAILAVGLLLMGGAGLFLGRFGSGQTLGEPGVRLEQEPIHNPDGEVVGHERVALPARLAGYTSEPVPVSDMELEWLPADTTYGRRLYTRRDGFQGMLSVVLMGNDRTSIHKPEYCLPAQGFVIEKSEETTVRIAEPEPYDLPVMKLTATREAQLETGNTATHRAIFLYWFISEDQLTADHLQRMWWMARDLMLEQELKRWAYAGCLGICLPGEEAALEANLKDMLAKAVPEFQIPGGSATAMETAYETSGEREAEKISDEGISGMKADESRARPGV